MKPRIFHGIILSLMAGAALFYLKYTVEQKETQLTEMQAQYLEDQKALRVLKAEWAYLNSPPYLQELTRKYLTVRPLGYTQVASWVESASSTHSPLTPLTYASKYRLPAIREVAATASIPTPGRDDEP
ncbi:MAG: hypothetical protein IIC07_02750 [Proteobacteria bacterium]|nr:hypothetical protein [Pseudomonadota bacterium]MCH8322058.1 hypothetical protein [Pseudomonadota bacterium]